jgi:glycosyltransferase involved in cell wall biosynthesis
VGHGPVRDHLLALKSDSSADNVFFFDNRPKREVLKMIHGADATVVPLKKLPLFEGAIPSKIFENLALQKPILLGVMGEAKEIFIDRAGAGWSYEPENAAELATLVRYLADNRKEGEEAGSRGFHLLDELFNPELISKDFFNLLKNLQ